MANVTPSPVSFPPLYIRRLAGAMALDSATYEDVEADRRATAWACLTVVLASVGEGVALRAQGGLANIALMSAVALMGWAAWALLTFEVGARLLPGARTHADVGELLRTLGFAAAPGLIAYLSLVPGLMMPVLVFSRGWMLLAMIVAVRQALDYTSTWRAIAVCLVGWLLTTAIILALAFFGGTTVS
jgi:hypothetical protein